MPRYPRPHPPGDWSKGNPTLKIPQPNGKLGKNSGKHKKLIVLCDGTGQDNYGSTAQNPTNITRISRALTPNAWVWNSDENAWEEWEQIVHYQAGIGTFEGNNFWGVVFRTGLSEIIRAAYGFLASNYKNKNKIYIFGFSRGAYIARSIAGLVADHGLLTKRGMDNFHAVYETFHNFALDGPDTYADLRERKPIMIPTRDGGNITTKDAGLRPLPPHTVEVVGVFDTVADIPEFGNNELSIRVLHAFHTLSLDETRLPFQTTLFFKPVQKMNQSGDTTILKQVWFSGEHSDIGGGMQDPRPSNIALGWMISELEHYNLLAFDRNYLLDPGSTNANTPSSSGWQTMGGANKEEYANQCDNPWHFWHRLSYWLGELGWYGVEALSWTVVHVLYLFPTDWGRRMSGIRTPGEYVRIKNFQRVEPDPTKKNEFETCEFLHESVKDRWMGDESPKPEGNGKVVKKWPCKPLKGFNKGDKEWTKDVNYKDYHHWGDLLAKWWRGKSKGENEHKLPDVVLPIYDYPSRKIEMLFKNNMRFEERCTKPWLAESKVSVEEAAPVVEQLPE